MPSPERYPVCPGCTESNSTNGWALVRHKIPLCRTRQEFMDGMISEYEEIVMAQEQFEAKQSTNVGWARYTAETQTLEIDFKKEGVKTSTYEYASFPAEEWRAFQEASDKGRHFAYKIRPRFKGVRIDKRAAAATQSDLPL